MKMNGNCAGGTGAFIEQMATLLDVTLSELDNLAKKSDNPLTIASRCGVFAKSDIQSLINNGHTINNISKAIFDAIAHQFFSNFQAGIKFNGDIIIAGGPLTFFAELRNSFKKLLPKQTNLILPPFSKLFVAYGAALSSNFKKSYTLNNIISVLENSKTDINISNQLSSLFQNLDDYKKFNERHKKFTNTTQHNSHDLNDLFVGIDIGSTTTKLVIINSKLQILDSFYQHNTLPPIEMVKAALTQINTKYKNIKTIFTTGYGSNFISKAFNFSGHVVETYAHYKAGIQLNKDISLIIDIGGQDVKAISIENGIISNIEINEACSSGTGSFIFNFAKTLNITLEEFIELSLYASKPVDLGSRCTVFMNSKVKDALRDGHSTSDIVAGLCYSIVKNILYKVVGQATIDKSDVILVQGGTIQNDAILRAFELVSEKEVIRLPNSHLSGAYGTAIYAYEYYMQNKTDKIDISSSKLKEIKITSTKYSNCNKCRNNCCLTILKLNNERYYITGNRCEMATPQTKLKTTNNIINFYKHKYNIFYNEPINELESVNADLGIPLVLGMFEHLPFYLKLFKKLNIDFKVGHWTTQKNYQEGAHGQTIDTICMPAKATNGHIIALKNAKVKQIFLPTVTYEKQEYGDAMNSYNCPVITGFSEVTKNAFLNDITIETPPISFLTDKTLLNTLYAYLKKYDVSKKELRKAISCSQKYQNDLKQKYFELGKNIVETAIANNQPLIILAGRKYHIDPLINHGIVEILNSMGAQVINEEVASFLFKGDLKGIGALTQWTYHNRLYASAKWLEKLDYQNAAMIQLNSFGCGPDAITFDELKSLLRSKPFINIKIDEMTNTGAIKLRIESLLFGLKTNKQIKPIQIKKVPNFNPEKHSKFIIAPQMGYIYSDVCKVIYETFGYKLIYPKIQNDLSVKEGLKYVNNDLCYPAILTIGDILLQLKNKNINAKNASVTIIETGGQCRVSNYASVLRKVLVKAGHPDIPVASLSTRAATDDLKFNRLKMLKISSIGMNLADAIHKLKFATRPYEINSGETDNLVKDYQKKLEKFLFSSPNKKNVESFTRKMVDQFNSIPTKNISKKKVGIVGEFYLRISDHGNNHIARYLEAKGYEVIQPGIVKNLRIDYYSSAYNYRKHIKRRPKELIQDWFVNRSYSKYEHLIDQQLKMFKRYFQEELISNQIKDIHCRPAIQFGEGWLLPMEIKSLAKNNVDRIISVQPFGCISCNIISKGMVQEIQQEYPKMKFLSLDFESGTTNVNILNRLEMFLQVN